MRREAIRGLRPLRPKLTGMIAMAVAAGFISWLVVNHGSGPSTVSRVAAPASTRTVTTATAPQAAPRPSAASIGPVSVTVKGLRVLVLSFRQPVYWAGPAPGRRYELTRTESGNVFVRYLPPGVKAGDKRRFLTVGTYPFPGAFAETQALANQAGALSKRLRGGGLAYFRRDQPFNVYLVYPKLAYQIEVYSPSAGQARQLVSAGEIRPVR